MDPKNKKRREEEPKEIYIFLRVLFDRLYATDALKSGGRRVFRE